MNSPIANPNERYLKQRLDPRSGFGYGLGRRTSMLLAAIDQHARSGGRLDVIDFGCADGAMLKAVAAHLGNRFRSGLGLDVFRSGKPDAEAGDGLRYEAVDLFRQYPLPIADESQDVVIASAFLKHHPEPARLLGEMARILRPGGCAFLLDPRPFVVNIGCRVGRFNPDYNPSVWSRQKVEQWLSQSVTTLAVKDFRRYWVAPTYGVYRLGLEKILPGFVENVLALHQCMTLIKRTPETINSPKH